MGFIGWIVLGLIAGAIAKAIMPGKQGGGFLVTLLLGVIGAVLGGWLGSAIFNKPLGKVWSPWTWLSSIVGALIVLAGQLDESRQRQHRRHAADDEDLPPPEQSGPVVVAGGEFGPP